MMGIHFSLLEAFSLAAFTCDCNSLTFLRKSFFSGMPLFKLRTLNPVQEKHIRKYEKAKSFILTEFKMNQYDRYLPVILTALTVLVLGCWNLPALQVMNSQGKPNGCPSYLWLSLIAVLVGLLTVWFYQNRK